MLRHVQGSHPNVSVLRTNSRAAVVLVWQRKVKLSKVVSCAQSLLTHSRMLMPTTSFWLIYILFLIALNPRFTQHFFAFTV